MLIPISEIENSGDHYAFKANCEIALNYQLEKVLFLTKKMESHLETQANSPKFYIEGNIFSYSLDSLINSLSTLTEYYHSWVIFSYIGTFEHKKTKYLPLKKDEKLDSEIDKIFKANSIGILRNTKNYKGDFHADCKKAFLEAYEFLFVGKFYEIYVLNNYLKHNMMAMGYAPKITSTSGALSIPYVHITKPNDKLLNPSVYKCLFEYEINNGENTHPVPDNYFIKIINSTAYHIGTMGNMKIYNINGIDYLKGPKMVGVSVESIIEIAQNLVQSIIGVLLKNSRNFTSNQQTLNDIVYKITSRSPQTLNKLIS